MAKEEKKRFVYVKDPALTVSCSMLEEAIVVKDDLLKRYPEPEFRVRNRYRSRTGTWDVLVKRRTEVKEQAPKATALERSLGEHAYQGGE